MINQSIKQRPFVVSPTTIDNDTAYIVYNIKYYSLEAGEDVILFIGKGYPYEEFGVQKFEVDLKDFYETLRNKNTFRMEEHFNPISSTDLTIVFAQYDVDDNVLDTETISFTKDKEHMSIKGIATYNGLSNKKLTLSDFDDQTYNYFCIYPILKFNVYAPEGTTPIPGFDHFEVILDTFLPYTNLPADILENGRHDIQLSDLSQYNLTSWVRTNWSSFYDNFIKQKTLDYDVPLYSFQNLNTQTKMRYRLVYNSGNVSPWTNGFFNFYDIPVGDVILPYKEYEGEFTINQMFDLTSDINDVLDTFMGQLTPYIQTFFKSVYWPASQDPTLTTVKPTGMAYSYIVSDPTYHLWNDPIQRYVEWLDLDIEKTPYPTLTFINSDVVDKDGDDLTVLLCEELSSLKGFTTNSYNQTTYKDKYDDTYVVQLDNKKTITCYIDPEWFSVTTNKNRLNYVLLKDAMYSSRLTYLQTAVKTINNKKAEINGLTNPDDDDFAFLYGRIKSVEDVKIPSKYSSNGEKMPSLKIEFEIYE